MILGFDCSTTTCGYSFCDNNDILNADFIDISKFDTNKEKSFHIISIIDKNPLIKKVTKINLESALSGFMFGRTSQQTVIKLARFNAIFEYIISEHWKLPVTLVAASTARKKVFGKARVKGVEAKEYVKQQLSLKFDLTKYNKINKIGNVDVRVQDIYDSIVIALYG